ncbi:VCBS repeat-containing protein [Aureitalea sp. L0-47]|nr:VCBS repeat-containing protein [Aureitalea sp. L0-47]
MLFCYCCFSCTQNESVKRFTVKTAPQTGIDFENSLTSKPELNILNYIYYYNGAGVAAGDFNNDGLTDLYFTANQTSDKLYMNKGELSFEDITKQAGINNASNWTTGVTLVDINQDGFLDIYVCKLGEYNSISGHNLLFVNMGPDEEGIPTFKEKSAEYGLDFKGFSTQASFFDYDLDGDLDVYLMNHSVNPNQNYGRGEIRNEPDERSGDKLFENIEGIYVDVTESAGIIQSKIGYGLGISVSDLNNDGYPDIYIGNDFFENDYLYLNKGDKTFEEVIQKKDHTIGHTTHFSMGNDIADVNNDGLTDIISVDMLPEDLETYKTSGTEFNYQIYQNYIRNGYSHQFMHNTLQLNNGNNSFSEIAFLSGIAASEWSWSPLLADFDNDGYNDLFISNGIPGATNDMDFINFIANEAIQKSLGAGMTEEDMAFIEKIPQKHSVNYFFRNNNGANFDDVSSEWASMSPSFSNGSVYTDLDNDGDLDLVINNINEPATILENKTTGLPESNYLQIELQGKKGNLLGIGTKVLLYSNTLKAIRENYSSRGYLSAVSDKVHFGLGNRNKIDSLIVIWPDRSYQKIYNPEINTMITIGQTESSRNYYRDFSSKEKALIVNASPLFEFVHDENTTLEFNRDPLIPYTSSNEGPNISVADVNNDGMTDIFIGGAKFQASELFLQKNDGTFESVQKELFQEDALSEDIDQVFFDADGDSDMDLFVVSGGNEFKSGPALAPRLYRNDNGTLVKTNMSANIEVNASSVESVDYDGDSDEDIVITSGTVASGFGETPTQYILQNDGKGSFIDVTDTVAPELSQIGNCNSQTWADVNNDGIKDLIVAGDWMPLQIFMNEGGILKLQANNGLDETHGFWNIVKAADMDGDGDTDLIAGNWGLNTRLKASAEEPVQLYRVDADNNGDIETIITYYYQGIETTLASKDELVKQIPSINKNYLSYKEFSQATVEDIFSKEKLASAMHKKVFTLESAYFENDGNGSFTHKPLPRKAQISSVNDILVFDFDNNGLNDLLLVGNNFEISTQLSRLDGSHGTLILNDSDRGFVEANNLHFDIPGASRDIEIMEYRGHNYLVVTRNNDQPVFFKNR